MDRQQLQAQLEQLHSELRRTDTVDERERETLRALAADIEELLKRGDDHTQGYGGLSERLKESVAQLEASHPEATLLMRQLIDSLAFMGI